MFGYFERILGYADALSGTLAVAAAPAC